MVKILIDGNVMNAARRAAKKGEQIEYRDTLMPGLAIRVKSATPYFWWLNKNKRLQICPMSTFTPDDLQILRGLIPVLKKAHSEGEDLKSIVDQVVARGEKNPEDARKTIHEKREVEDGNGWTWKMARDKYLESLKAENRNKSYSNNVSALGYHEGGQIGKDFTELLDMPMKSIQVKDLSAVLKRIRERGKKSNPDNPNAGIPAAILCYSGIQAVFKFSASSENSSKSGLEQNIARLLEKPKKVGFDKNDPKARAAAIPMLVSVKQLRKLLTKDLWHEDIREPYRRAIYLQALTGQRIQTVLSAHKNDFVRVGECRWDYVWRLGPDKMGAFRLLPLPKIASYAVFQSMVASREDNMYLFPQLRKRFASDEDDGSMHYSVIKDTLNSIKDAGTSLPADFAGTHDFRRAFITHLSSKWREFGFDTKDDIELITHKNEGRDTVAQSVYNKDDFIKQKYRVLEAYQDLIFDIKHPDDLRVFDFYDEEAYALPEQYARMNTYDEIDGFY